jgi:hypothetical protein
MLLALTNDGSPLLVEAGSPVINPSGEPLFQSLEIVEWLTL